MKLQWKNKLQRTVMAGVFAALLVVLSQVLSLIHISEPTRP